MLATKVFGLTLASYEYIDAARVMALPKLLNSLSWPKTSWIIQEQPFSHLKWGFTSRQATTSELKINRFSWWKIQGMVQRTVGSSYIRMWDIPHVFHPSTMPVLSSASCFCIRHRSTKHHVPIMFTSLSSRWWWEGLHEFRGTYCWGDQEEGDVVLVGVMEFLGSLRHPIRYILHLAGSSNAPLQEFNWSFPMWHLAAFHLKNCCVECYWTVIEPISIWFLILCARAWLCGRWLITPLDMYVFKLILERSSTLLCFGLPKH